MAEGTSGSPPTSRAQPIATGTSPTHTAESAYSGSPSRASATARLAAPIHGSPASSQIPVVRPQHGETKASQAPLAGATGTSVPGPGASSLSQALRGSFGRTTSGLESSANQESDPNRHDSPERGATGTYGSFAPSSFNTQPAPSPRPNEDIEVLKRHLVNPGSASPEPGPSRRPRNQNDDSEQAQSQADDQEFSSLRLQGGDTTRHIYRYAEKKEREQTDVLDRETGRLKRSMSFSMPKQDPDEDDIQSIQIPGGFRRDHLRRTAGSPAPSSINRRPDYGAVQRTVTEPPRAKPQFVTSNFIEFLTLYGHFAGEDLDEDDEVLGPDDFFSSDAATTEAEEGRSDDEWGEDSALLTPGKRKRRRKAREGGNGTPFGAAMLLLKSFVGTGVLFLPRAYYNGGMLFANLVLIFIAALSYYAFILLVSVRLKVPASFGGMGGQIYGKGFQGMINFSLVISQIGFASAYTVFVAENLQAFVLAVTKCKTFIEVEWFILIQMIIFLPISLYRNINNIQKMALVADLFICLGLIYLYYYDIKTIVERPGLGEIRNFNAESWTLFIGTAIFTFEGIGLIIPIQSSMRQPNKFPAVLAWVMVIISVIFISMGALSYAAYGEETKTVIILNMPQDDKLVNGVQFLYSLAILLSTPLQIYPAIEITSQQLFSKTGKYNPWIKWQKNIFRFFMVVLTSAIAWLGANDLDKFVSLVGSFACIPLVYIYPPMMHYRVVATRTWQKVVDVALVIFGFCIMAYATAITIFSWIHGGDVKSPGYCDK